MPYDLSPNTKKYSIDPFVTKSFEEFWKNSTLQDIEKLNLLKNLCLQSDPERFILKNKVLTANAKFSFLDIFLNPTQKALKRLDIHPALNNQIIYLARAKLALLVLAKMRTLQCVDKDWIVQAQTKLQKKGVRPQWH